MDHFERIYASRAADYHRLIAAEDVDGQLLPAIERVASLAGRRILDLGTGTGRLPLLIGDRAECMIGIDVHLTMLQENRAQRDRSGGDWRLAQGDMRAAPLPSAWADVVTAGWTIGHLCGWFPSDWRVQIGRVLREMQRIARPGGALIVIETLTTGSLAPAPPTPRLAEYYAWLESEWGFARQTIRTDYQFESVEDAVAVMEFFFGPEIATKIRENDWARTPEWTGVWSRTM